MKTDTPDIDKRRLARVIQAEYGLDISSFTFLPKGEDAYCYQAEDRESGRHFVRVQPDSRGDGLETAYQVAHSLHGECGLSQVVAPYATRAGKFVCPLDGHLVAIFPFIEGRTAYDNGISDEELAQAAALIAAVHGSLEALSLPSLPRECFENPFKAPIHRALETAQQPAAQGNDYQRQVCQLLAAEHADILATLEAMEQRQAEAQAMDLESVLTHGDPNLDNLLKDERGTLHLTDWGEVAVGPPERDLFAFTGERFEPFLQQYVWSGKRPRLHAKIFAFYFYRWSLQEIADYTTRILFTNREPIEDEHAWTELREFLPIRHEVIARGVEEVQTVLESMSGSQDWR
jgi:spectinomycin phosphotransferase